MGGKEKGQEREGGRRQWRDEGREGERVREEEGVEFLKSRAIDLQVSPSAFSDKSPVVCHCHLPQDHLQEPVGGGRMWREGCGRRVRWEVGGG